MRRTPHQLAIGIAKIAAILVLGIITLVAADKMAKATGCDGLGGCKLVVGALATCDGLHVGLYNPGSKPAEAVLYPGPDGSPKHAVTVPPEENRPVNYWVERDAEPFNIIVEAGGETYPFGWSPDRSECTTATPVLSARQPVGPSPTPATPMELGAADDGRVGAIVAWVLLVSSSIGVFLFLMWFARRARRRP